MTYEEEAIQQKIYVYFHNNYPHLRGLLCYNLNNSKDAREGSRNRALGLQAGRSDLVMYYNSKAYMIELKTKTGKQSQKQKDWQSTIEKAGFEYCIIRSLEEFQFFLKKIGL